MTQFKINPHSEIHSLHKEAIQISENLIKDEFLMIEVLQRIDQKKVYKFLGFKSLFQYATIALKLSESRGYTFILVARKALKLSKFQDALKSGLNISKAKRIASVILEENQDHWIKLANTVSQRSLERAVAKVNPKSAVEEGLRFISEDTLEFKAAVSLNTETLIKRVQDLLSQSMGRAVSYDEALKEMAKTFLDKKDPVVRAQRVMSQKIKKEAKKVQGKAIQAREFQLTASKNKSQDLLSRSPIPILLKHQINLRDQGKCQITNCGDSRWVDIHHIKPVSKGGQNILENLITLCRSHHQLEHFSG